MQEELRKIIINAGKIIKENFYSSKQVKYKGEIDLVTQFDIEIEKFLREHLSKLFPDFLIIGEEEYSDYLSITNPNRIYIDPIDGTTNFVHSIPFVAISIGIFKNNEPWIGVVYNPLLEEFFYAESGKGSFFNNNRLQVSSEDSLKKALVVTGFPYNIRTNERALVWNLEVVKRVLKNTLAFRRLGSAAIDLCYVARGSYEIFYEMGLKPWDVAAGMLIVKEAGGRITNEKAEKYDLDKDEIIVATNNKLHEDFINLIL